MAATTQIQVIISAQDNATKVINGVGDSLNGVSSQSTQVKKGADLMNTGFLALATGILAVSAVSVKMASDFQSQMLLIQTQAGASAQEVRNMTKAVLELAPAVGQSPAKLAEGLYYIESAGYSGAKALDILKLSAEGAAIGHDTLADVSKALTSVLNSQIKGVNGATQAMGVMDAIVGHGKMTMTDLTGAISTGILPAAKQAGVSLQSLGSALDVMTNNGIPATDAATRLRMTITLMADPTSKATDELKKVGLTQRSLADDMQKGGLIAAITDLNLHMNAVQQGSSTIVKGTKETGAQLAKLGNDILDTTQHLKNLGEQHVKAGYATDVHNLAVQRAQQQLDGYKGKLGEANTVINTLGGSTLDAVGKAQLLTSAFGGARSGSTIELLTQQTDALSKSLSGINDTSGKFAKSWQATQDTNAQATARLFASVQVLAIQYGDKLLPAVTAVENWISANLIPALSQLATFFDKNKLAIEIIAGIITAVVLPAMVMWQVQMAVNNVAAIASFIIANDKLIFGFTTQGLESEQAGVKSVAAAVKSAAAWVVSAAQTTLAALTSAAKVSAAWVASAAQSAAAWVVDIAKMVAQFVVAGVQAGINAVKSAAAWVLAAHESEAGFIGSLLKIVGQFIYTSVEAGINAVVTSAAWIVSSTQTLVAWVATTPKMVIQFVLMSASATKEAIVASAAWIKASVETAAGWVLASAKAVVSAIAIGTVSVVQSAIAVGAWLLSIAQIIILNTWMEIVKASTVIWTGAQWLLNAALDANPIAIVILAIAALVAGIIWAYNNVKVFHDFINNLWDVFKNFISWVVNTALGVFNTLAKAVSAVGSVAGGNLPKHATGGVVAGAIGSPQLIIAHGGEVVTPVGTSRGSSDMGSDGGGGVNLSVNVGLYAGSDTEKRNIAKQLYQALQQLASSQHKTVAQFMGG